MTGKNSGQGVVIHHLTKDSVLWKKPVAELIRLGTTDTFALFAPLTKIVDTLQHHGYYAAAIDSVRIHRDTAHIYFYQGEKFHLRQLTLHAYEGIIPRDSVVELSSDSIRMSREVDGFRKSVLGKAMEAGYPFAAVRMVPDRAIADSIDCDVWLMPGNRYTFGGLHVVGDLKIAPYYLSQMIGLPVGSPYFPDITEKVSKKIRELTFAEQYKSPAVVFAEQKAWLALFLKKKNVNRFDLLIGLQPNPNAVPGVTNKLLITGNATVELVNQFGQGEKILGEYFQPSANRQQLRLEAEYPFLLSTPIGVKTSFKLFRADSTFTEKIFELGGQYYFSYDSKLEVFWNRGSSAIGTVDTQKIIQTKKLPANLDYKTDYFGLSYTVHRLDFKLNPRRGYSLNFAMGVGQRNIYRNGAITSIRGNTGENFDYNTLYDTVTLHSTLFRPSLDARWYLPFLKRMSLMLRTNGAMIAGPKIVYNNEKFRIGGNKSFRGWNEQSIYTTSYLIATNEVKMNLDELSALFVFADNGWINPTDARPENFNWYLGLGAGINFATKVGVFGLSIAVGKNGSQPFDFQAAKIHFGYQSIF
ncbi:MAG: BamA/TamA family outer membrane protein [Saprospiraceae bacterium]|nr:BamA/TamA family outer membrane protein [Saprospiraceae bacterium]